MDARQLEYFVAIAEHGGFSRAAAALHIAQPSLSQAIANLEAELGVPLFHRTGRGVTLSRAGRRLLGPSRQVLRDLAAVRDASAALTGLRQGTLDLAAMPSPGIEPFGALVRRFARRSPEVTISATAAFTPGETVELVRDGACELGLLGAAGRVAAPGLDVLDIEEQPFVVVAAPGGPVRDGVPVAAAGLAGLRLIVAGRGSTMRGVVDGMIAEGADLRIAAEVGHRTSILPLVLAGVGAAVLPDAWTALARRCGAVAAPVEHGARLRVALVSRRGHLTPAARAFLGTARRLAAERLPEVRG
ncbi:LysR family transcriptional regulator [Allonocardiopsis opalescens]|uniref:DNA-binding transcriptional LysR family regulator n=1 Tax=Allonocardiopsis opalescens TaxID=1144618 RepID=A0A2T0Q0D7_9ACTN|nr:LysR family transcriptional regulator [Allonocardiopsis opalescens]PRX97248.1 DNA-binding transcriptional LysR family regulator [Allonocardiopsis opalescens]